MNLVITDGGRKAAGYTRKSKRGDCAVRAVAIALEIPYEAAARDLQEFSATPADVTDFGVRMSVLHDYLAEHGWKWTATMGIGTGCKVHLCPDELPGGHLIVRVTGHLVAVIERTAYDLFDPSRDGRRCVYGYWSRP